MIVSSGRTREVGQQAPARRVGMMRVAGRAVMLDEDDRAAAGAHRVAPGD